MALDADLERIAAAARRHAEPGEELAGVIAAEPEPGRRVFLCAFEGEARTWLALDEDERPVEDRALVRAAVSIAALCELAEESVASGGLGELRAELERLRPTERSAEATPGSSLPTTTGIAEAQEAALELARTLQPAPRLASPAYLDAIGAAARRLERALGDAALSPFAEAMKASSGVVEELALDVLGCYKLALS
jgi:hypothetical protein